VTGDGAKAERKNERKGQSAKFKLKIGGALKRGYQNGKLRKD
jgi:hypothetical protein